MTMIRGVLAFTFLLLILMSDVNQINADARWRSNLSVDAVKDDVVLRLKPGLVQRSYYFIPDQCEVDEGLLIFFRNGVASVRPINTFVAGDLSRDQVTYYVGNDQCQIAIEIRKHVPAQ